MSFVELANAKFELVPTIAAAQARHGLRVLPRDTKSDTIDTWIRSALAASRLLVLTDALDELDRDQRSRAATALNSAR